MHIVYSYTGMNIINTIDTNNYIYTYNYMSIYTIIEIL